MRMGAFPKTEWAKVDRILRPEIKTTLYLPQEATGNYLYGSDRAGGCGIRLLAEDADIADIDTAFKLLTSPDPRIKIEAEEHLKEMVRRKTATDPQPDLMDKYLSGEDGGVFQNRGGGSTRNVWSRARMASKRNEIKWTTENNKLKIYHRGVTMENKNRRNIMRTMRDSMRSERSKSLIDRPDPGRTMECVAAHLASTHFLKNGDFTRFADWRFLHRARLNLVPLNGSSSWRAGDRRCRRCGYITESLAHVVDHCMRYTALYMARHNNIVERVKKATLNKFEKIAENQVEGSERLRPDLIIRKSNKILIIDVTIPFDNRMKSLENAAKEELDKYEILRREIASQYNCETETVAFVVGALGSWYPPNGHLMKKICSPRYAELMRKLCVSDTIGFSRDIYIQHLTDIPQRQTGPPNQEGGTST